MSITDNKMAKNALSARMALRLGPPIDGVLSRPTISVNAGDHTKFDVSAFSYRMGGHIYAKAAQTAIAFSAVHATGIGAWLGIGIYIDQRGTITTAASPNTGDQDYGTEALALASIPASTNGALLIGTITLRTGSADWDANTDALDAADLVSANLLGLNKDRRWNQFPVRSRVQLDSFETFCRGYTATVNAQVLVTHDGFNGPVTNPGLEVDRRTVANASVTKLRYGAFDYMIDGVLYHKNAGYALAFSAAHPVTADKWGAILVQIDAAGTISTRISGATQTTAQAYTSSAAARAALPAPTAGNVVIGCVVVEAKNATWTANTDDLVAASDLESVDIINAITDRLLDNVTLAIDAVPEKFKLSAAVHYSIAGVKYTKAAATAIAFSAAHACTASKYLAILVQVDEAGAVSSLVPYRDGRSQTAAQGYDNYDAALAALPQTEAGKVALGAIVVLADSGGWTAQTDDMTAGSDLTSVWFVGFKTNQRNGLAGVEPTNQNALWPVNGALFVADANTSAAFEGDPDVRPARGFSNGTIGVYFGATTVGVAVAPEAVMVVRPFPLDGEGMQVAKAS